MIEGARYGRMALGRCVTQNYGHIGCGTDVTSDFDLECSGRRECVISVISLHDKRSCPKDFKSYLEAGYRCVKVFYPNTTRCPPGGLVKLVSTSGHIASVVAMDTGLGTESCPIRIQVAPYQRINLTLIDLAMTLGSNHWYYGGQRHPDNCHVYAALRETGSALNRTICGGRIREAVVYTTRGNVLDLWISSTAATKQRFLLRYEAFGCPPLSIPPEAWSQMYGDHVVVHCNETDEAWYLTCRRTKWVGHVGNCTHSIAIDSSSKWGLTNVFGGTGDFPLGILIVVTLGVAIGVAIGVMMLVAVLAYMKRRRRRKIRSRSNYILKHINENNVNDMTSTLTSKADVDAANADRTPMIKRERVHSTPGTLTRHYLDTWQRTRPLPVPRPTSDSGIDQDPEAVTLTPDSPGIFVTFRPDYETSLLAGGQHLTSSTYPQDLRDRGTPYYFKVDPAQRATASEYGSSGRPDVLSTCNLCRNNAAQRTVTNL
ncbi:hypothetical protein LSH36_410g02008 [Paralvinella palmiformis]|uniref:SUEL-type lectin domain-containing protein n=1 Tax=Paralvinella palmiformis TaxID=53620 RepID=A0AAD9JBW1_9ANNE|nr:hypothetical protein LSH36_410g02008 [Paralvinella palmiformis]